MLSAAFLDREPPPSLTYRSEKSSWSRLGCEDRVQVTGNGKRRGIKGQHIGVDVADLIQGSR